MAILNARKMDILIIRSPAFRLYFHKIYFDSASHYIWRLSLKKALHTLSVDSRSLFIARYEFCQEITQLSLSLSLVATINFD